MNLGDRLREELRHEAGTAVPSPWEEVRQRAAERKRRREVVAYPLAALAVLVVTVAATAGIARLRDDGDAGRSVTAGPAAAQRVRVPDRAVALTNDGRIVVINARTGKERRTIARGALTGAAGGVAVSPDGRVIYFTRPMANPPCQDPVPQIMQIPTAGGAVEAVSPAANYPVTGSRPLASPDGTSLVLAGAPCGQPLLADLNVTIPTALPALVRATETYESVVPLAWSPDSARIAYRAVPDGGGEPAIFVTDRLNPPVEVIGSFGYTAAAFRDDALVLAETLGPGFRLVRYDETLHPVAEELLVPDGGSPSFMQFERAGRHLLYVTSGDDPALYRWVRGDVAPVKLADGIVAAGWIDARS